MNKNEFDFEKEKSKIELDVLKKKRKKLQKEFDHGLKTYRSKEKLYNSKKRWRRGYKLAWSGSSENLGLMMFLFLFSIYGLTIAVGSINRYFFGLFEGLFIRSVVQAMLLIILLIYGVIIPLLGLFDRYNPHKVNELLLEEMEEESLNIDDVEDEMLEIDKRIAEISEKLTGGE